MLDLLKYPKKKDKTMPTLLHDIALHFLTFDNLIVFILGLIIGYLLPRKARTEVKSVFCYNPETKETFKVNQIFKKGFFVKHDCPYMLKDKSCPFFKEKCHLVLPTKKECDKA